MRKVLLSLIIVLFLSTPCLAEVQEKELGITFDVSYWSKWLSKGVEAYGQDGAIFETVDLDFYGTGFGLKVTHRSSTSSGHVDARRFDYRPYYKNSLFEGTKYLTNYNIGVGYEHYPGRALDKSNTTFEWIFGFSWPKLLDSGIVPKYVAHYEYPASGGDAFNHITGWVHRFILGYNINVPQLPSPVYLSTEVAYNDGLGGTAHDWSYFTTGLSTKFPINDNLTFVPCVYYQISMEDTVSKVDDIIYTVLSMKYKF